MEDGLLQRRHGWALQGRPGFGIHEPLRVSDRQAIALEPLLNSRLLTRGFLLWR
jgi:hypothetical protein